MKNKLIIYAVPRDSHPSTNEIYAFFDNYEQAEVFVNRFNALPELIIEQHFLTPGLISNQDKSAYCVLLHNSGKQAYDLDFYQQVYAALLAKTEEYTLEFHSATSPRHHTINLTLFATCKAAAIKEAITIRNAIVPAKKWKLFYLKGKNSLLMLNEDERV